MKAFFDGVLYHLSDCGIFVYADFRPIDKMAGLEKIINEKFEILRKEDIRRNVYHSLIIQNEAKKEIIKTRVPWYGRWFMRKYFAIENTTIYNQFKAG